MNELIHKTLAGLWYVCFPQRGKHFKKHTLMTNPPWTSKSQDFEILESESWRQNLLPRAWFKEKEYADSRRKNMHPCRMQNMPPRALNMFQGGRLLIPLLGGVVTIRERTSPLPTSPTCEERQAQLLLCPANCVVKTHSRASREIPGLLRTVESEVEMLNSFRTRA